MADLNLVSNCCNVVLLAATSIAHALQDRNDFAIVGGAAVALLGGARVTADVDVVVASPVGLREARAALRSAKAFEVEKRTLHTYFENGRFRVSIDLLCPGSTFRESFDPQKDITIIKYAGRSAPILKPVKILNGKCQSLLGRTSDMKKATDAADIVHLLLWLASNPAYFDWESLPNASREFVAWFIDNYGGGDYWAALPARPIAVMSA